jgi:hypothetical protein
MGVGMSVGAVNVGGNAGMEVSVGMGVRGVVAVVGGRSILVGLNTSSGFPFMCSTTFTTCSPKPYSSRPPPPSAPGILSNGNCLEWVYSYRPWYEYSFCLL